MLILDESQGYYGSDMLKTFPTNALKLYRAYMYFEGCEHNFGFLVVTLADGWILNEIWGCYSHYLSNTYLERITYMSHNYQNNQK